MYQAYSDESGINNEDPYTSVSIVSGEDTILNSLREKLVKIISEKKISEVKFVEINGYQKPVTNAARSFIKTAVNNFAALKQIRIDTLTVDNKYLLSVFPDYDIEQKFEHMYHCLLSHIGRIWNNLNWNFYPDTNSEVNWNNIVDFLNKTRMRKTSYNGPLLLKFNENPLFQFDEVRQLVSIEEPLIQLADVFAGLTRFSHEQNFDCSRYAESQKDGWQGKMKLGKVKKSVIMSQTNECRNKIIGELYGLCHKHRLYVSIKTKKHLWTRKMDSPVNFWDYRKV